MNTATRATITRKLGAIRQSASYLANYARDAEEQQSAASISRLAREIEGLLSSPEPPASAAMLTIAGHDIDAPGFTPESFDAAIKRAHDDGIQLQATEYASVFQAVNPSHGTTYTVTRRSCTCRAGERGIGCKHRALAVMFLDILSQTPTQAPAVA